MLKRSKEGQELQINPDQMKGLEAFIAKCKDGTPFAKRAIIWLLRQTNRLSNEVAVYFPESVPENEEVAMAMQAMYSCNGQTFIYHVLRAMGSHMMFVSHCGFCLNIPEGKDKPEKGHTIWIAREFYDSNVPQVKLDLEAINAISLEGVIKG